MRNSNVTKMTLTAIFLALAIILQLIGRNFVNINPLLIGAPICTLILLTTYVCGIRYGLMISILIPLTAIPLGALAPLLIPFAPFIVIGNLVFAGSFALFMNRKKAGIYIGVLASSVVKFLVLSFFATKFIYMLNLGIPEASLKMIGIAFTTPQLILSIIGGAFAIIIAKILERRKAGFMQKVVS